MDELVSAELEALEYTYGSEAVVVLQQTPLHVQVSIAPHTGDLATERYVNADLILRATEAYPAEAPTTRVVQARGDQPWHRNLQCSDFYPAA